MYLSGSKWSMRKRRRRTNPWRVLFLLLLVLVAIYVERVVVQTVPPLFIPTPAPTRSPASFALEAEKLFKDGKLEQAAQAYQEAIKIDPTQPGFYINLARVLVLIGDYDGAEEHARDALLLDSDNALAHAVLAWALDFKGDIPTAMAEIERALELDPTSALAHAYYAEILLDSSLENYQQALEEARKAVNLDPNLMESYRALGYVWERTGSYEQAIEAYQAALRANSNLAVLHLSLGSMYLANGEINQAIDSYLKASGLAPNDVRPYQLLALANARVGEYGKASQWAEEAVRRDPGNPKLHGDLGRMYYKNNQFKQAIAELGLAIHGGELPGEWTVAGQVVSVNSKTTIVGDPQIGDEVRVIGELHEDGTMLARWILLQVAEGTPTPGPVPTLAADQVDLVGAVEAIVPGVVVPGLEIDPADAHVVEFYYTYGLALAKGGDCDLARQIAETLLLTVREDELAAVNAEETLRICGALEQTPTPEGTLTPAP